MVGDLEWDLHKITDSQKNTKTHNLARWEHKKVGTLARN